MWTLSGELLHEGSNLPDEYISKLGNDESSSEAVDVGVILSGDSTISPNLKFPSSRDDVAVFTEGNTVHMFRRVY